jgi:hypothetical protein
MFYLSLSSFKFREQSRREMYLIILENSYETMEGVREQGANENIWALEG